MLTAHFPISLSTSFPRSPANCPLYNNTHHRSSTLYHLNALNLLNLQCRFTGRATSIFRFKRPRMLLTLVSGSELISPILYCYWLLARRITAWSNLKPADWRFVCPWRLLLLIGFLFGAGRPVVVNGPHVLRYACQTSLLFSCPCEEIRRAVTHSKKKKKKKMESRAH